jgi:predicted O-methyltransferase YrrM
MRPHRPASEESTPPESVLATIDEPFRSALLSLYAAEPQLGIDGQLHEINRVTGIDPQHGMWLYDLYRRRAPGASMEVGMAYGCSTLFFLAAIAKLGAGSHTAIDPGELSFWHGIGMQKVRQVGAQSFRLIEDTDYNAAADLTRQRATFDFIFIDGNHRFDDALVDFTLFAPLLNHRGLIVFDDIWMPSIRAAVAFIEANRLDFKHIPGSPTPRYAVFERIAQDARQWDHFVPFSVPK